MSAAIEELLLIPELIRNRVRSNLHANLIEHRLKRRQEWDGDGFDILYDIVLLWHQPEEAVTESWGYHSGVIRHKNGEQPAADVFWGHYKLSEPEARKGFLEKGLL